MEEYFNELNGKIATAYEVATRARSQAMDPDVNIEAKTAGDLAARVEGLVGPEGIEKKIKELGRENISQIADYVLGDVSKMNRAGKEERIEQALRTTLAIITEGVVAAPIEGIARAGIKENPDGSQYLAIYFAGPIRSAGGTAQGRAVLLGDYLRGKAGLQEYRPTGDELERYVEEIKIYNDRVTRLQYMPSEDDIREIVRNVSVCVDGDPTEEKEVSIHRDLKRVETNRIRGGMCLVIGEGIAQKAPKLIKHATAMGLDWNWLAELGKGKKEGEEGRKSREIFMSEVVGGRPVLAAPSAKGAFRLRYGRSRASGIAGKCIHPAAMILLDEFVATGTQVKVERPGKGCIMTNCDEIEGPIVKLRNGSVIRVDNVELARSINEDVVEILFLGDILISYGDFLQTNTSLLPAGYCEEWWLQEVGSLGDKIPAGIPKPNEVVELSKKYGIPLHPRYTYAWEDISVEELHKLGKWLSTGEIQERGLVLENRNSEAKRIMELLGVPHLIEGNWAIVEEYNPLLYPIKLYDGARITQEEFESALNGFDSKGTALEFIQSVSRIEIRPKIGTYIGARVGRPEKARERKMHPAVHSLFPIGNAGGKERSLNVASQKGLIRVEISRYKCPNCRTMSVYSRCSTCGNDTLLRGVERQEINLRELWGKAIKVVNSVPKVKGVKGMISKEKIPEPLEKGILRAKNEVYVFKDGTIRFDATDAPLTHFKAGEVGVSVEKLKELGYRNDYLGEELENDEQILELRPQDIVLPEKGGEYLLKVSKFIDNLLSKFYGIKEFYQAKEKEDLLGHLVVGLAPHTSAGIVGRIVGFTKASVCYAHPYWHAAKRRNADGDEDSIMLILDTLINFSKKYLPETRGGKMDAPLVITTILDPKEVDDEAHKMEIISSYPVEFYQKTWQGVNPSEVDIKTVNDILNENPYSGLSFTHNTENITGPVTKSRYLTLNKMRDKVKAQLKVAEKIRAIDEREVAELVINSHFIRDIYGNLRTFSKQKFRCVKCNASYRRPPLIGKCTKCGDRLLLTVSEGTIRKYLEISLWLTETYNTSDYLKQRLLLLRRDIDSLLTNDLSKQMGLADFM